MFLSTLDHTYPKSSFVTIGAVPDCDGDVQIGQTVSVGFWYFSL